MVRADLPAFFVMIRRVGRDPGLLLLTLRALRQRSSGGSPRLSDLSWILWATRGQLLGWLDALARHRLVVWDRRGGRNTDALVVEIALEPPNPATWPVDGSRVPGPPHELPTYWFVQVLPRLGRTRFLVYLYLLSREEAPGASASVPVEALSRILGLGKHLGVLKASYHLGLLARFGLVRWAGRSLVVLDPPPLTRWGRFRLRLLQWGFLPLPWRKIILGALAIALVLLLLGWLVTHPPHVLHPSSLPDGERPNAVRLAGVLPGP